MSNYEVGSYTRTKQTPFEIWNKIPTATVTYSKKAKLKRNGKYIDLQEYTNKSNEDCTIYQVLEKYNGDGKMTREELNKLAHQVGEDVANINSLSDAFEMMKQANQAWNELPMPIRKEFDNDVRKFQTNGVAWANKKMKEIEDLKAAEYKKYQEKIKMQEEIDANLAKNLKGDKANG